MAERIRSMANRMVRVWCMLALNLLLLLFAKSAICQVTIPVTWGSTPTCLGRMYSDIIIGSQWGSLSDLNAAATFANTSAGVLGLTIFLEVHPFGDQATYDASGHGGSDAMHAIASTGYNRWNTKNTDYYPTQPSSLNTAVKNMSGIWKKSKDGSGALTSTGSSILTKVLKEAPDSQDCSGLMYSWVMAINYTARSRFSTAAIPAPPYTVDIANNSYYYGTLFFNSDGSTPSVSSKRTQNLHRLGVANAPFFPNSSQPWYFWTIIDAEWTAPEL